MIVLATAKKEMLLLSRDIHALAVLFLMPLAFLIIMSLAMPNANENESWLTVGYVSTDSSYNKALENYLLQNSAYHWQKYEEQSVMEAALASKQLNVSVLLPQLREQDELDQTQTQISFATNIDAASRALVKASVAEALGKARLFMFLRSMNPPKTAEQLERLEKQAQKTTEKDQFIEHYAASKAMPTSVQQSVPAWLVFGMFFIIIPLSSTLLVEIQQGTLKRLQTMNVSVLKFLSGKILPYLLIHQLQFFLMLACGKFLMPLLGVESLAVNGSWYLLCLMAIATSIAALGFALFIAVWVNSIEQATAIGGGANIILAALGGIMIPKYVMPENMQFLANVSPMSWSLDGFLTVILSNESLAFILPQFTALLLFGAVCFLVAVGRFKRITCNR